MSLLNGLTITGGKLKDLSLAASQLDGLCSMLRYATDALEADALDIVPRARSAITEQRLMEKALVDMEGGGGAG
jgi:hypothetical protein